MNNVYCTQPRKVSGKWTMNVHEYGVTLGLATFDKKENALKFRAELDNWDKICERVPTKQPEKQINDMYRDIQLALAV